MENGIIYAIDKYLFTKDTKADKKKKKAEKDKQAEMDNEIADKRRKNKKAAKVSLDLLSFNEEPGLSPRQITPWLKSPPCRPDSFYQDER